MQLNVDYPLVGGSPLFPNISCEAKREVCIVTTGEAEINAAATSECTQTVGKRRTGRSETDFFRVPVSPFFSRL